MARQFESHRHFFVVLVHTSRFHSGISLFIFSFFMPLFFFISGLFISSAIKEQSFASFLKKRLFRLMVPYLVFSIISYVLWFFLFRHFGKGISISPLKPLIGIFYGVAPGGWLTPNVALWFFTCLMTTEMLFFFLVRIPSRRILCAVLFLSSVAGYLLLCFLNKTLYRLPWNADLALIAVVFYGGGYLSKGYILTEAFTKWHRWVVIIGSLIFYLAFTRLNTPVAFFTGFLGNYLYFFLAAFSGILFWAHMAKLIRPCPLLTAIGQNTLVIFSLHLLVFPFFTAFLVYGLKIQKDAIQSNAAAIAYTVISMLLLLGLSKWIRKYVPWLIGK